MQFCAGDLDEEKDTCFGDSGGGIYMYDEESSRYILVGIISWGMCLPGYHPGYPGLLKNFIFFWFSNK